jgi:CheY-like chemotaxis protein
MIARYSRLSARCCAYWGDAVRTAQPAVDGIIAMSPSPSDVVLLDLAMPGVDGLDALPRFRNHYPNVPLIVVTPVIKPDALDCARAAGAFDILSKPFAPRTGRDGGSGHAAAGRARADARGTSRRPRAGLVPVRRRISDLLTFTGSRSGIEQEIEQENSFISCPPMIRWLTVGICP